MTVTEVVLKNVLNYLNELPATYLPPIGIKQVIAPITLKDLFDPQEYLIDMTHASRLSQSATKNELKLIKSYFELEIELIQGKLKTIADWNATVGYLFVGTACLITLNSHSVSPQLTDRLTSVPTVYLAIAIAVMGLQLYREHQLHRRATKYRKWTYLLELAEISQ